MATLEVLSFRAIVRRSLNVTGQISARTDILGVPHLPGRGSLRTKLRFLDAIYRFAPEVRLHHDDPFRPSSVAWYLQHVRMRIDIEAGDDKPVLDKGQVNTQSLISQRSHGQHSGENYKSEFFLQIPNDGDEHETRQGYLPGAECYIHFRPAPPSAGEAYDIQYWFFYPYNGEMGREMGFDNITEGGAHEGDWEHITVRTRDGKEIESIFFSAHEIEGKWYPKATAARPDGFRLAADGHPIVYSADNSHASYPTAGEQRRSIDGEWWIRDYTADSGPVWRCWEQLVLLGQRDRPLQGQYWIKYNGRWGEVGSGVLGTGLFNRGDGPYGPAMKKSWYDDEEHYIPPEKTRLVFYGENNCSGEVVGETSNEPQQVIKLKHRRAWNNDKARSLGLFNVPMGTSISVFRSTSGSRGGDFATIRVKQQVPDYCINSFERTYEDDVVHVTYLGRDGLDGEVSRIEVD